MVNLWQVALSAGLLSALWAGMADLLSLVTWIGFLGASTYFAQSKSNFQGVLLSWCTNLSGVFWGYLVINGSGYFDIPLVGYLFTGIVTAGMCLQASIRKLSFIPGTFIGSCSTFAMQGDVASVIPALIIGAPLGYAMTCGTTLLISLTIKWKTHTETTKSTIK